VGCVPEGSRKGDPRARRGLPNQPRRVVQFALHGIFGPGNQTGIIRLGSATTLEGLGGGLFPGYGIKFLRSGVHSADWVGLRATGPGGSWDFFNSTFSNHVAPADVLVKTGKFQQASGCITMVGLSDAASLTQAGEKVAKPVFPFELRLRPTGKASFPDKQLSNDDLLKDLAAIPVGTELVEVYAYASPNDKFANKETAVGTITTTGSCHQSLFVDTTLFFQHQRMEVDFAAAPEWITQFNEHYAPDAACTASAGPVSKWQCVPSPSV